MLFSVSAAPEAMHIPDGFLSVPVSIVLWIVAIAAIGYSLLRVERDLGERQVPLMGVLAACIFAGQMLNFPVAGGTSGHLIGAAIATILLGPWAAILVVTCVVAIQALLFQDGGLVVLGANIANMAVVGVAVSYLVYSTIRRLAGQQQWGVFVGGFAAGWLSVFVASLAVALQLAISGRSPADIALPAMAGVHALIGIGEGLITVGALAFLFATRRDLVERGSKTTKQGGIIWVAGLVIAVVLAIASPLASGDPDGLERVAEDTGFLQTAEEAPYNIIPDYTFPGVSDPALATILAGIVGVIIVFVVAAGLAYLRRNRSATS